ncbi:hypothetical protein CC78DRAFT_126245 [Lojkania enalia]|uniref:Uncharacterized protein n=1 Tax=Lojkania enalia TaxID=147567 RepID=A0A9P4JXP8_9PLEO|nr:hypothetical protein CC78DRAFT_126245 [Didymosphaeria enalia]
MGKQRRKVQARQAAEVATKSTSDAAAPPANPEIASSRPTDDAVENSKRTQDTASSALPPYSSEGPTLPIIEATEAQDGIANAGEKMIEKSRVKKRESINTGKLEKSNQKAQRSRSTSGKRKPVSLPVNANRPTKRNSTPQVAQGTRKKGNETRIGEGANLAHLREPWLLLPPPLLETLHSLAESCIPLPVTRNTNITSTVNKLKTHFGANPSPLPLPQARHTAGGPGVLALSAQGDGIVKLASIVEVGKRVVGAPVHTPASASGTGEGVETWFEYSSLSSFTVEIDRNKSKAEQEEEEQQSGDEEAFESIQVEEKIRIRKVPVLTVWMSRTRIPVFADAFGEKTFLVQGIREEG